MKQSKVLALGVLFCLLLGFSALPVAAACIATQNVGTLAALNTALTEISSCNTPGTYTINLTANLTLNGDIASYSNPTAGVDLVLDGANFAIEGGDNYTGFYFGNHAGKITVKNFKLNNLYGAISHENNAATAATLLLISANTFSSNLAYAGAGVYAGGAASYIALTNNTFINNLAGNGGAVYLWGAYNLALAQANVFTTNRALGSGGAIFAAGNSVASMFDPVVWPLRRLDYARLENERSTRQRDVIGIAAVSNTSWNSNKFTSNTAAKAGGAIYVSNQKFSITASAFVTNSTRTAGGAIYLLQANATVSRGTFNGNRAANGGSAIHNTGLNSRVTVDNNTFLNNVSTTLKGAIFADDETILTLRNNTLNANNGGALQIVSDAEGYLYNNILTNSINQTDCVGLDTPILVFSAGTSNIIRTSTDCGTAGVTHRAVAPGLGALTSPSSYSSYYLLAAGSPALNTGDNAKCLTTSQNGVARPVGTCDLGSVEMP